MARKALASSLFTNKKCETLSHFGDERWDKCHETHIKVVAFQKRDLILRLDINH
jgi:hypothetical protein